jgi:hypothetical protein
MDSLIFEAGPLNGPFDVLLWNMMISAWVGGGENPRRPDAGWHHAND